MNTIVGASIGLRCHDGWGYLLPWLGNCLWGVVGVCVFGRLSVLALHLGGGRCGGFPGMCASAALHQVFLLGVVVGALACWAPRDRGEPPLKRS